MPLATPKELDRAYDDERLTWLRKRFFLYAGLSVGLSALSLFASLVTLLLVVGKITEGAPNESLLNAPLFWVSEITVTLAVLAAFIVAVRWVQLQQRSRSDTIRLIYILFVGAHLLEMGHILMVGVWIDPTFATGSILDQSLIGLFLTHFIAAIIIPWTVRESIQPLVPIVIVHASLIALFTADPIGHRVFDLVILALIGVPGMTVCWLKQTWFQRRFRFRTYRDVYHYVSREVEQARALHESFFPERINAGPLQLDYYYQPMSQLGGDYLHAHVSRNDEGKPVSLFCAVIDVTGHGLPATLTANHLHALLKRQTQRSQRPDPGELIEDLNRYMHESFSGLSVFATALCMRIDLASQRVLWASAGHPPGFLVSAGHCEPALESTACLLGVVEPELYSANTRELPLSEDVQLFAYTDGASELPLPGGGMLGITGLAERMATLSENVGWTCKDAMADLAQITTGSRQDDILIVQLGMKPEPGVAVLQDDDGAEATTHDSVLASPAVEAQS